LSLFRALRQGREAAILSRSPSDPTCGFGSSLPTSVGCFCVFSNTFRDLRRKHILSLGVWSCGVPAAGTGHL